MIWHLSNPIHYMHVVQTAPPLSSSHYLWLMHNNIISINNIMNP